MSRRCSQCGHDGHNSRTCLDRGGGTGGGFKLFGVQVAETPSPPASVSSSSPSASPSQGKTATVTSAPTAAAAAAAMAMRKSFSMGNLSNYGSSEGASPCGPASSPPEHPDLGEGYASDDVVHTNCSSSARERKKGVPWTEEEHRSFLLGLRKLGKGDWRGISRNFVKTRTPTQVASHAQKYFLRRNNLNKRRRRSSLFDITPDTVSSLLEESVMEDPEAEACHELNFESTGQRMQASLALSRNAHLSGFQVPPSSFKFPCMPITATSNTMEAVDNGSEANELEDSGISEKGLLQPLTGMAIMETVPEGNDDMGDGPGQVPLSFPVIPIWPVPGYYWPDRQALLSSESKVVKPTPIIPVPSSKIDETIRLSELSLNCTRPMMEPTPLSYQLLEDGSRQSAFHSMSSTSSTDVEKKGSLTTAISVP